MSELTLVQSDLPAHIRELQQKNDAGDWGTGQSTGFPVISIKGSKFHVRRGDETKLVTTSDGETPAISLPLIIVKTHAGLAKTYFEETYVEGSDSKPTCYSVDGVAPATDSEERQAKSCSTCPHNQWGSRITEAGTKAKRCSDVKRLAVSSPNQINDPMLLRVPPSSLKKWNEYTSLLAKRGCTPTHVITKVSFEPNVAYPSINFDAIEFVSDSMVGELELVMEDALLDTIVGTNEGIEHHAADESLAPEEVETPPPPAKKKAAKKPKQIKSEKSAAAAAALAEAQALVAAAAAEEASEDNEESAPPPAPKKKRASKKKVEPEPVIETEDEDEDEDELDFDNLEFDD